MTISGFNFDELGDRLGVDDDTQEIERQSAPRRAVGQILQPTRPPTASPVVSPVSSRTSRSSDRRERGERSSANLPVALVAELSRYKQRHRWELSQLIRSALDNLGADAVVDPDGVLNAHWEAPRTARHYQLQHSELERLDAVGERWRMNRSQVISVLVVLEAQRLGLSSGS